MKHINLGYTLSSEELNPQEMVMYGKRGEEAGFSFLSLSDHFHPWSEVQGESPFVFSIIGALSQVTSTVRIGTGITCPIIRYHPAIIAQAVATCQYLLDGRFFLGVGAGENLNEHIVGDGWPATYVRQEMLIEAIEIMKELWKGEITDYYGKYYTVDKAKIYSLPEQQIPIIVSAYGPKAAAIAGEYGDGFWTTSPDKKLVKEFEKGAGTNKPKYLQISACFDTTYEKALKTAHKYWAFSALPSPLNTELKLPSFYDKAIRLVTPDMVAEQIVCGPNIDEYMEKVDEAVDAGFTDIYFHQVGPNQEAFLQMAEKELIPRFERKYRKRKEIPSTIT